MKLHRFICIVCASLIAISTFVCGGVFASASTPTTSDYDTTDIDTTATVFDIADKMSEYATLGGNALAVDVLSLALNPYIDAKTGGYLLVDDTIGTAYYINVDGILVRSKSGDGGGGGVNRHVTSGADIDISGETFAKIIARLNEQYGVKDAKSYISIQTEKRYSSDTTRGYGELSFFAEGEFFNQAEWLECYMIPFYFDGSQYWYGLMERHFTQELVTSDDGNHVYMDCEVFSLVDDTVSYTSRLYNASLGNIDLATYRYIDIFSHYTNDVSKTIYFGLFNSASSYVSCTRNNMCTVKFDDCDFSGVLSLTNLYSEACLSSSTYDEYTQISDVFKNAYSDSANYVDGIDFGFLVSNEPMDLCLNWTGIDPEKIDPELTVTMDGDTIYDYSVTTINGDTTTVNEYVTNNYTIIIDGGGSSDGDGGSTSGDVNVGGNVNVSGDIDVGGQVDININVNDNRGEGMTVDAYEYQDANVEEVLEQLPEMGDGFTGLMSRVLGEWMPPQLFTLLLGGVGLAIVCRIAGR